MARVGVRGSERDATVTIAPGYRRWRPPDCQCCGRVARSSVLTLKRRYLA
jgi:hypothetical protein